MVTVETAVHRRDGVTFVTVTLTNRRETAQRVTVRNALPGPTWPPRRRGVSPEWDGHTWQGVLEAGERRGVGFASPTAPTGRVIELLEVERATGCRGTDVQTILSQRENAKPPRPGGRA